ncbi:MAG: hypothetical protein GY757_25640 [bacterium]|nr:hypothetical protein [bacterium]
MKNISTRRNNSLSLSLCLSLCLCTCFPPLRATDLLEITEPRAHFFILQTLSINKKNNSKNINKNNNKKNNQIISPGSNGLLYLDKNSKPAGSFILLDKSPHQYLCRIDSLSPGVNKAHLKWAAFTPPNSPQKNISLKIAGQIVNFHPLSTTNHYFLSQSPFPLKNISPRNVTGIKEFLYSIEKSLKHLYQADLIRLDQIRPLNLEKYIDFNDNKKVFLGTNDGQVCMVFPENGEFQGTRLSAASLKKFQEDFLFFVLLKKVK